MSFKAILSAAALSVAAGCAGATTVLGVDGPRTGSTTLGLGQVDVGVAQTFTTVEDLTDASFTFDLRCFDCSGDLWLIEGVMSTSILNSDVVASTIYTGNEGADAALTDLDFIAGTYTIILTMTGGNGFWRATDTPTQLGDAGTVLNEYETFSSISGNFLPWSATETVEGSSLMFSVDVPDGPVVAPVPLPAGAWMLLAGLMGMAALRRRS